MRYSRRIWTGTGLLMLASCGGGGGVGSTPAPSPTPSQATSAVFPLQSAREFESAVALRQHFNDHNDLLTSSSSVIGEGATVIIEYRPPTSTYVLRSALGSVALEPNNRTSWDGYWQSYKIDGAISHEVKLYGSSTSSGLAAPGQIQLTYLNFGRWSRVDNSTGTHNDAYFLYGFPTDSKMPVGGTATYRTMVTADQVDIQQNTRGAIDATAEFSVDFGAGTVATALLMLNETYNGAGNLTFGDRFVGTFTDSTDNFFRSGEFAGGFSGPDAREMGYAFGLWLTPKDGYGGASLRYPDMCIIGAVVGTRN